MHPPKGQHEQREEKTRGSSVVDSSDLEQPNISAEFSDFVRSAFDKMGVKMANIITGQQALEVFGKQSSSVRSHRRVHVK